MRLALVLFRVTWSPYTTLEKTPFFTTLSVNFGSEVVRRDLSGLGLMEQTGTFKTGLPINPVEMVTAQRLIQMIHHRALGTTYTALIINVLLYVRFQQVNRI